MPAPDDRDRILSALDGLNDFAGADQGKRFVKMKRFRMEPVEGADNFDPEGGGIHRLAISQKDLDTVAGPVLKTIDPGYETHWSELDPVNLAPVQI